MKTKHAFYALLMCTLLFTFIRCQETDVKPITVYTPNDIYYLRLDCKIITSESGNVLEQFSTEDSCLTFLENITARDANNPVGYVYNDIDAIIGSLNGDCKIDSAVHEALNKYHITDSTLISQVLDTYYL